MLCHPIRITSAIFAVLLFVGIRAASAEDDAAKSPDTASEMGVDFARDIAPILSQNCVACHNAKKPEGGLDLESHTALMQGGDSGQAVTAGDTDDSYLLDRVTDADDRMPPDDNTVGAKPLTEAELDLLRRWIEAGALAPEPEAETAIAWQRVPEHLQPVYAMAASDDGSYLAVGRGNTVEVIPQTAAAAALPHQRLLDANLQLADGTALQATHLDIVQSVAFSPDSQRIATGGYRNLKIWRRQTAARELLAGLTASGTVAAISPAGNTLAYAAEQHSVELVDLESGEAHRFLKAHAAPVTALLWMADNLLLTSDEAGGMVLTRADDYHSRAVTLAGEPLLVRQLVSLGERLFGVTSEGRGFELIGGESEPADEAASSSLAAQRSSPTPHFAPRWLNLPEGSVIQTLAASTAPAPRLIVALASGSLALVDPDSSEIAQEWKVDTPVQAIQVSSDGATVATIPPEGPVKLWKVAAGEVLAVLDQDYTRSQELRGRSRNATRQQATVEQLVAQIPELQKAAEAEAEAQKKVQESRDQAAKDLADKVAALVSSKDSLSESETALTAAEAALAEAMKRVETLKTEIETKKKAIVEAETKQSEAEKELAKREQALATSNDSVQRASERVPAMESRVAEEKERLAQLQAAVKELESSRTLPAATACGFSPNNSTAFVAGSDSIVRIYSTVDGSPKANLQGATAPVFTLQPAPAEQLVALSSDGRVLAWDLNLPWQLEHSLGTATESPFSDRVTALDFSPNGQLLAVGSGPPSRFGEVKWLDVASGTIVCDLGEVHSDTVLSVSFSPDGRSLASGAADKLARLFDVESGEMVRAFEGHTHHVLAMDWHDSGSQLATGSADNTVKIWTVASGEQQRTISGFSKEVTAVQFVGQTQQMAATAADGSVRLYTADNGKLVRSYSGAENAVFSLALSADGKQIAAAGQTGQVWMWQIEDGKLLNTPAKPE
ncbi:MAG: hypothetical protein KDA45_01015 [Planctomycetales bacterium]|nr:hypothetical protein [Planctomycetales bacterium]